MSERDDYDDAPRPSWRPTLAEREPARSAEPAPITPDPRAPEPRDWMHVSSLVLVALAIGGTAFLREAVDDAGLARLDQPWRFLVLAAVIVGWAGTLTAIAWRLDRRASRTPTPPELPARTGR